MPRVFYIFILANRLGFCVSKRLHFKNIHIEVKSSQPWMSKVKSCKIVWCILNLVRVLYNLIIIFNYFFVDQANLPLTKKNFFLFSQWWENLNLFEVVEKYLTFCGVAIENCQNFTTSLLEYKKNQGNGGHTTTLSRDIRASFRKNMSKENFFI